MARLEPLRILLIEDSEDDAFFLLRAFERESSPSELHRVPDGEEAIKYLEGSGKYSDREKTPLPDVIVTDLKMPHLDGFGLLKRLKKDSRWQVLPAIVLSSSTENEDVRKAYRLGANAYLAKPTDTRHLQQVVRTTHDFWTECIRVKLN